jgi:hypothetical protein
LHAKRAHALLRATSALVQGAFASLSGIALFLDGAAGLKHRIKRCRPGSDLCNALIHSYFHVKCQLLIGLRAQF